ncbi:anaerobic carbon-monoxide dehydrogenase catalytic subunit [Candidatus Solincola tengchongensis]|uniref:anaerobic carbon-monoxide dehydrogenase catalytic subunit n=1 Tax=Candidatus Solincola tengchongensis TaxID=2900693 RepID=UPI00257A5D53|nr:anaerobic carbon-monoxide dehydrogenase catalytic subunit [Candidatus Solincola tengchongensis]
MQHDVFSAKEEAQKRATHPTDQEIVEKALREGVETAWDRLEKQQPQCGYGQLGLCCNRCAMGPCRIDPFGEGPRRGVCGADADLIVSRNLLDDLAVGAAAHSDHAREVIEVLLETAEGRAQGYRLTDVEKLRSIAAEYGLDTAGKPDEEIARELALAMLEEFGTVKNRIQFTERAPEKTTAIWKELGIMPRGVDREIVGADHRIQMGVGADYTNVLVHALRASLADGWGGSMMATFASDILFGTPSPKTSTVNLGVLEADKVNVITHGHNPILSEMIVLAAQDPELLELASQKGAKGINVVGMCCTGNELLMRHGVPVGGSLLDQELAIATGAVEAMVVDYQCVFPSLAETASCYHTKVICTSEKAVVPGAVYLRFAPESALDTAKEIVRTAVENFPLRNPDRVKIPGEPASFTVGFSEESIRGALGGSYKPLIDAIVSGQILGAAGVVGCNNPKIKMDHGHVTLVSELIKRNILVVETGCAAYACGKAGLLRPEAADMAGEGLASVCKALGVPPVLHMGSCVDCSRILNLLAAVAKEIGVGIGDLPVVGAAPEWYSQKAISIGAYFVASGVNVVLGIPPKIFGSANVVELLASKLKDLVQASFAVEPDPLKAADLIESLIREKRKGLNI